jgi:putative nucleotidyltransferase with HDIG domain
VEKVLEEGKNLESLSHLNLFDKYTFQHCVNVCVFATLMGKNLGYELPTLLSLGTAALLHDIGKCFVPNEIINKEGPLVGDEIGIMRTHPQRGLRYLEREGYPDEVCLAAFEHHEQIDGSGYPLGIAAEKIHPFSSIIAVADFYDALTTDRSYRRALTPLEALGIMRERAGKTFSEDLFRVFLRGLEMYPVGSRLLLDTGDQAVVVPGEDPNPFLVELNGGRVPYGAVGDRVVDVLL